MSFKLIGILSSYPLILISQLLLYTGKFFNILKASVVLLAKLSAVLRV